MDVLFFLKERLAFIRRYYETAAAPFHETIRRIENGEPPYQTRYSEHSEPAYQLEWSDAHTSLEVLGRSCISMVSASIQLYLQTWANELGFQWQSEEERARAFKKGMLHGYQYCLGSAVGLSWAGCPARLDIIEQIVLARNSDQHPQNLITMDVPHGRDTYQKFGTPFFVTEFETAALAASAKDRFDLSRGVQVSRNKLEAALAEVEALGAWLDEELLAIQYRHARAARA